MKIMTLGCHDHLLYWMVVFTVVTVDWYWGL